MTVGEEQFHFKALPDEGCSIVKNDALEGSAVVEGRVACKLLQPMKGPPAAAATAAPLVATSALPKSTTDTTDTEGELKGAPAPLLRSQQKEKIVSPPPAEMLANAPTTGAARTKTQKTGGGAPSPSRQEAIVVGRREHPPSEDDGDDDDHLRQSDAVNATTTATAVQHITLRSALISILSERPSSLRGIKKSLAALEHSTTSPATFKIPPKGGLETVLKEVAMYKPPGIYVLKETAGVETGAAAVELGEEKNKRQRLPSEQPLSPDGNTTAIITQEEQQEVLHNTRADKHHTTTTTANFPAPRRPSSVSRGRTLGPTDAAWVLRHANRQPEPAPAITNASEYEAVKAEFQKRHKVYSKLRKLLAANRMQFEALDATLRDAEADASVPRTQISKIEDEIAQLWAARARCSEQWAEAYEVLHQEVEEWTAALDRYSYS